MIANSQILEKRINNHRIQHKLRVLWPDFETYDLLDSGIDLDEVGYFTSNPVQIIKIDNINQELQTIFTEKSFTHMAIHKELQFDDQLQVADRYYVILSRRGIAVDELNCRFVRGSYILTVQVAQIDRQTNFWGAESIGDRITIIDPKQIVKKNCMWILEFQSPKPVKSLLFYSIKREPRYGKSSYYEDELPRDVRLQFCMKIRIFPSYLEKMMSKEEETLIQNIHYVKGNTNHIVTFGKSEKKGKDSNVNSEVKLKIDERSPKDIISPKEKTNKTHIFVKILQNCTQQEIFQLRQTYQFENIMKQIKNSISNNERNVYEKIQKSQKLDETVKKVIQGISFTEIMGYEWSQITKMIEVAHQSELEELHQYLISIIFLAFSENSKRSIENWMQLEEIVENIENAQFKETLIQWKKHIMAFYCRELLKDCDQQIYDRLRMSKTQLVQILSKSLASNQQTAKVSDLLSILMRIENKKDIFDLYREHQLLDHSLKLTSSLRNWQKTHHFYVKEDADVLYETDAEVQYITYTHIDHCNQVSNSVDKIYDFALTTSCQFSTNYAFFSSKPFSINGNSFQYFLFRKSNQILCFLQEIPSKDNRIYEQKFSSYEICIQITITSQKLTQTFGWNFIPPSLAVGSTFDFKDLDETSKIHLKISMRRNIIHESILNYLRVRYEQLVRMTNKCSQKLQSQNKKLLKRRSSLFLERNLFDIDFTSKMEQPCFLHRICEKCQSFTQQSSIYQLSSLDLYGLMYSAPFMEELNAFLTTIKHLIMTPSQLPNQEFWMSQIKIKHLHLHPLLRLVNQNRIEKDFREIVGSLIEEKIKENALLQGNLPKKCRFLKSSESRVGRCMWTSVQQDYSKEYLQYLNNVHAER